MARARSTKCSGTTRGVAEAEEIERADTRRRYPHSCATTPEERTRVLADEEGGDESGKSIYLNTELTHHPS